MKCLVCNNIMSAIYDFDGLCNGFYVCDNEPYNQEVKSYFPVLYDANMKIWRLYDTYYPEKEAIQYCKLKAFW